MILHTAVEFHAGRRLRVTRLGSGRPLVLLHGYPDNLQVWCRLAPLLSQHFEVIAFDWPGLGYSEPWSGGATPMHMAERLRTLVHTWRIEKPLIAGIDMGGQPALAYAARWPDEVRSLIVMNSLVQWDEATSWEIAVLRRFGWNSVALRHFPRLVFARALHTFLPAGEQLAPPIRTDMWDSFKRREVREFIVRMCAGYQGNLPLLARSYASIEANVLVLWGECDKHFPVGQAKRLHAALPNAELQIIAGAHHWMPLANPEVVCSKIREFAG